MQYENFHIKPIEGEEIDDFLTYFDNEKFYYLTKRPDTTNLGMRKEILQDSFVMYDNDTAVGLAKIVEKKESLYSEIMLAFFHDDYYSRDEGKILTKQFLENCINIYNPKGVIYIKIYKFNDLLINHCKDIGFRYCGELSKSVYKFGEYYNTVVLSYSEQEKENE